MRLFLGLLFVGLVGCGGDPGDGMGADLTGTRVVAVGTWGGEHITLEVAAKGATAEYDCAHGTIDEALSLDGSGAFDAKGVHTREHGGPIRPGEAADNHPARYTGKLDGTTLSLQVRLTDTGDVLGPFTLAPGPGRVYKCL